MADAENNAKAAIELIHASRVETNAVHMRAYTSDRNGFEIWDKIWYQTWYRVPNIVPDLMPHVVPELVPDLEPDLIPDLEPDLIHNPISASPLGAPG